MAGKPKSMNGSGQITTGSAPMASLKVKKKKKTSRGK
jgi:hypothetical protein